MRKAVQQKKREKKEKKEEQATEDYVVDNIRKK